MVQIKVKSHLWLISHRDTSALWQIRSLWARGRGNAWILVARDIKYIPWYIWALYISTFCAFQVCQFSMFSMFKSIYLGIFEHCTFQRFGLFKFVSLACYCVSVFLLQELEAVAMLLYKCGTRCCSTSCKSYMAFASPAAVPTHAWRSNDASKWIYSDDVWTKILLKGDRSWRTFKYICTK